MSGNNRSHTAINKTKNSHSASGFTLIEVGVAMAILSIGLLGLAGTLAFAMRASNQSRNVTSAKLIVTSTLEQIEALRNAKQLRFKQIANTGEVINEGTYTFGGFATGFQPVSSEPGCDGIYGTADDLMTAGADGICGNADDEIDQSRVMPGYSRQIDISLLPGNSNLKRVEVRLRYPGRFTSEQELVGVSYVNNDARSNYIR